MTAAWNKPFVMVSEDDISELIADSKTILVSYKTNNECFYWCNGKNIFIR